MRFEGISTERNRVKVDKVTLAMTKVVFFLVHLEIGNKNVLFVAQCVVERHRALVIRGARRLRKEILEISQTVKKTRGVISKGGKFCPSKPG